MINEYDPGDPGMPRQTWPRLEQLNEPSLPVLAKFVHACSADSNERTLAVTQLVICLCQLSGRRMLPRLPSIIVVSANNEVPAPVDTFGRLLIPHATDPQEEICLKGPFTGGCAQNAPRTMANAILNKQALPKRNLQNAAEHQQLVRRYFAAQSAGFGYGPSREYAKAWHEAFHLITNDSDELILRLESAEDRALFCKDVVSGNPRLRAPFGYGSDLTLVPKLIAFSGSLAATAMDAALATSLVDLGPPLLILPSLATRGPSINEPMLQFIAECMPRSCVHPVQEPANFLQTPWFDRYGAELRSRLRHLPMTYEYSMQNFARQLYPVCLRIAQWCGKMSATEPEEIMALAKDLCGHCLRGVVLSVAGLAWHGLGIDTCGPHQEFLRVLDYLRSHGPMTGSELLRRGHIADKETRDRLVECFEVEGLVRVDGKTIQATTYAEFVEVLYSRKEFPEPENYWRQATGKSYDVCA